MARIRLVTFDILHTLIIPRQPIHVQYAEVFRPFLGTLEPDAVKASFKTALKAVQKELPAYQHGAPLWWAEVIKRTALGAGADAQRLDASLHEIVPTLLKRFSSREGYRAFEDALPTISKLRDAGVDVGIISNGDMRFRLTLEDLGFPEDLRPFVLSEEAAVEKPDPEIYQRTIEEYNRLHPEEQELGPENCLHVGDELECDFHGAKKARFEARLLRRPGPDGEQERKEPDEDLTTVEVIRGLGEVLNIVARQ